MFPLRIVILIPILTYQIYSDLSHSLCFNQVEVLLLNLIFSEVPICTLKQVLLAVIIPPAHTGLFNQEKLVILL